VIVKLALGKDGKPVIHPLFASLGEAWESMAAQYSDEQKALLLAFLQQSNALAQEEIARLRDNAISEEGVFSVPLDDFNKTQLIFYCEGVHLNLHTAPLEDALYQ